MKIRWLINPFERIAGWQALFIGIVVMVLAVIVGKINNFFFEQKNLYLRLVFNDDGEISGLFFPPGK